MLKTIKDYMIYHCVDGNVKIVMNEAEYKKLLEYIEVCDGLLDKTTPTLYSEPNCLLKFNDREIYDPALVNFGLAFKSRKLCREEWLKIKNVKKERYNEQNK